MSAPILLPVLALPGLLCDGLVLADGDVVVCTHVNGADGSEPDDLVQVWSCGDCQTREVHELSVDLRAGRARDAVLRVMWMLLHPDVSDELMSAPAWLAHDGDATPAWSLATFDDDGDPDTSTYFADHLSDGTHGVEVPELEACRDEDSSLRALLASASAVGGL